MKEKHREDLLVLSDVPVYAKREKNYQKPSAPDVSTVRINLDPVRTNDDTLKIAPEPITRQQYYQTQSYSRKGADFAEKRKFQRKPDGKLIEEKRLEGEFLKSVSVFEWGGDIGFYEKFRSDAERYRNVKGAPCPHVPFFSYVPQYSQMKTAQFDYYFYLRDEIRSFRYPVSDLSYVLLYVYELINLGDSSDNKADISALCGLWNAYRTVYPVLDKYLSEWVADYCLIHSVDLPDSVTAFLPRIAARSSLKEFYLEEALKRCADNKSLFSECLISACSDFVPEKSRYLNDDPVLLKQVKSIFAEAVAKMIAGRLGLFSPGSGTESVIKRDAYSGSLCSYSVKKRLSVSVFSPFRSQEIRREVTEILRYCENIVRKNAGIRSRLTVDLPSEIKNIIDNGSCSRSAEESYLAFYDAPEDVLSIEGAIDLENSSWDSTERLVGDVFDDDFEEVPEGSLFFVPDAESPVHDFIATSNGNVPTDRAGFENIILKMIYDRDLSFEELCREAGAFPDSAASDINEYFSELIGDIVLENVKGKYVLVEDYIDEIKDLIEKKGDRDETG